MQATSFLQLLTAVGLHVVGIVFWPPTAYTLLAMTSAGLNQSFVNTTFVYNLKDVWRPQQGNDNLVTLSDQTSADQAVSIVYVLDVTQEVTMMSVGAGTTRPTPFVLVASDVKTFTEAMSFAVAAGPVPVISLLPHHVWHVNGKRFSNGLIPQLGQRLKGRALAHLLLHPRDVSSRRVLVIRGKRLSLEMREFYATLNQTDVGNVISVEQRTLSSSSKLVSEGERVLRLSSGEKDYDVIIVDCRLDEFQRLISAVSLAEMVNENAWIVYLHDFVEIQASSTAVQLVYEVLQDMNVQVFAFCQTVRGQSGNCMSLSSPASIYSHLLTGVLRVITAAASSADFHLSNLTIDHIYLPTINRTLSSVVGGSRLLDEIKKQCVQTPYGLLSLTAGDSTSFTCYQEDNVQFEILYQNQVSGNGRSRWVVGGHWSVDHSVTLTATFPPFITTRQQYLMNSTIRTTNINGTLSVLYGPDYPPFTFSNGTHNHSGVDFDIIYLIAERIGIDAKNVYFTRLDTDKYVWTDLAAQTGEDNSLYDLAIGGITVTAERSMLTNFTRAYLVPGISILKLKQPVNSTNVHFLWRFFEPFKWTAWLAILGMVVISAVTSKWLGLCASYSEGVWLAWIVIFFMNENRLVTMGNPFGRLFVSALSLVILILVAIYTANMATFLTFESDVDAVRGISSLKNKVVSADNSSNAFRLLKQQTNLRHIIDVPGLEYLPMLRKGRISAYIGDSPEVIEVARSQRECDLVVTGDELFQSPFAFAISDRLFASHGHLIDDVIVDLVSKQTVSALYDLHLKYKSFCHKVGDVNGQEGNDSGEKLDVANLGGVFIITAAAAVFCLICKGLLFLKKGYDIVGVPGNVNSQTIQSEAANETQV